MTRRTAVAAPSVIGGHASLCPPHPLLFGRRATSGGTMRLPVLAIVIFGVSMAAAQAADICKAVALRDVAAVDNPEAILKAGAFQLAVTEYRVDKKTGIASFCAHGGSCYPVSVTVDGKKVEALRLVNCTVAKQ